MTSRQKKHQHIATHSIKQGLHLDRPQYKSSQSIEKMQKKNKPQTNKKSIKHELIALPGHKQHEERQEREHGDREGWENVGWGRGRSRRITISVSDMFNFLSFQNGGIYLNA